MREILYKYNNRGLYQTDDNTSFGDDSALKFVIEPHDFSLAVGGEVLRSTSFDGGSAVVSHDGAVAFYDKQNNLIGSADKGDTLYKSAVLNWQPGYISILFGHIGVVDYYPNCDGEHDRWGEEWVTSREVTLDLKNNSVKVK